MRKITVWLERTATWFGRKTIHGIFYTSLLEANIKEQDSARN
ncbi:hypothetical protein [Bacillus sp. FJAT-42376]|nr:hypothetical protein [Bacillus sp. FJAT-42376]